MGLYVSLEVTSLFAGVVALFANKRPFPTVNQHVGFHIWSNVTCVAAQVATVGVLSIVLMHLCFDSLGHLQLEIAMN